MKKTLGMMISSLRKETGMTQLELAEKMATESPKDFGSMKNKKRKRSRGA